MQDFYIPTSAPQPQRARHLCLHPATFEALVIEKVLGKQTVHSLEIFIKLNLLPVPNITMNSGMHYIFNEVHLDIRVFPHSAHLNHPRIDPCWTNSNRKNIERYQSNELGLIFCLLKSTMLNTQRPTHVGQASNLFPLALAANNQNIKYIIVIAYL